MAFAWAWRPRKMLHEPLLYVAKKLAQRTLKMRVVSQAGGWKGWYRTCTNERAFMAVASAAVFLLA
eukprot:4394371-Pleurochrysis_carterae.AAC.1